MNKNIKNTLRRVISEGFNGSITDQLDGVIDTLRETQKRYEEFADSITGTGYRDEIDGITKDINKLESKLLDVKSKTHELRAKQKEKSMKKEQQRQLKEKAMKSLQAEKQGRNYSY